MVEDGKVAREFRSEGIPRYKGGKNDRRLWNAGMRGLHDVENRVLQRWLVQQIMPHRHGDPRLADIACHHRYLSFTLRNYVG
jgi:hypothetical protein